MQAKTAFIYKEIEYLVYMCARVCARAQKSFSSVEFFELVIFF